MRIKEDVKLGFIGAGVMGTIHMETFGGTAGAKLAAIAEPSPERLAAVANRYDIAGRYASGSELIADSDVDAVVISVPNAFHAQLAIDALRAGKHVLLEKPMAMNAREAGAIHEARIQSGKTLLMGHQMRWQAAVLTAKRYVDEGRLGRIYYAKAGWMRREGIPGWGTAYTRKAIMGGGCVVDIGVHMLDLALYLCAPSKPIAVSGGVFSKIGVQRKGIGTWGTPDWSGMFDVDDLAAGVIRLEGGGLLQFEVSWAAYSDTEQNEPYLSLMGERGGLSLRNGQGLLLLDEGRNERLEPDTEAGAERLRLAEHFLACVKGEAAPLADSGSGLLNQATLDALYESAQLGRECRVVFSSSYM